MEFTETTAGWYTKVDLPGDAQGIRGGARGHRFSKRGVTSLAYTSTAPTISGTASTALLGIGAGTTEDEDSPFIGFRSHANGGRRNSLGTDIQGETRYVFDLLGPA